METLPERLGALRSYTASLPRPLQSVSVNAIDSILASVDRPPAAGQEQLVEAGATALHTLLSILTVFVLAFYWLVERASIKRVILRAVPVRRAPAT